MMCFKVTSHNRFLNTPESFITNRINIRTPETRSYSFMHKQRKLPNSNLSDTEENSNEELSKSSIIKRLRDSSRSPFLKPKIRVSSILNQVQQMGLPEIYNKKKRLYTKLDKNFGTEGWNETYAKYFIKPTQMLSRIQVEQVKRRKKLLKLVKK